MELNGEEEKEEKVGLRVRYKWHELWTILKWNCVKKGQKWVECSINLDFVVKCASKIEYSVGVFTNSNVTIGFGQDNYANLFLSKVLNLNKTWKSQYM